MNYIFLHYCDTKLRGKNQEKINHMETFHQFKFTRHLYINDTFEALHLLTPN